MGLFRAVAIVIIVYTSWQLISSAAQAGIDELRCALADREFDRDFKAGHYHYHDGSPTKDSLQHVDQDAYERILALKSETERLMNEFKRSAEGVEEALASIYEQVAEISTSSDHICPSQESYSVFIIICFLVLNSVLFFFV